ncbi:MAG: YebC/PmpR family DNA-binding transcriptional regulator, partial [Candidatus Nanopelagicaceae bacterium]
DSLKVGGIEYESADISFLPTVSVSVDGETAKSVFELIDAIEDLDDVQNVYGNFDLSEEVMASLS